MSGGPSPPPPNPMKNPVLPVLESPANWFGVACAGLAAALLISGFIETGPVQATGLVAISYVGGFAVGGLLFGFTSRTTHGAGAGSGGGALGNGQHRMTAALAGVRAVVRDNPGKRLKRPLRQQISALCDEIDGLARLLGDHRDDLSAEDVFRAERIATRYLPDALKAFLAIPKAFATTEPLDNGRTAQQTLEAALSDIEAQTRQLGAELARRGARNLVNQAAFLEDRTRRSADRKP